VGSVFLRNQLVFWFLPTRYEAQQIVLLPAARDSIMASREKENDEKGLLKSVRQYLVLAMMQRETKASTFP
jgi:hypothetical protein